ncbi:MAG: histidine kinase [Ruminococcus sp.]|nr:histidine kinase [Ruminococcus sp.]
MSRWLKKMPLQRKMAISYAVLFGVSLFAFLFIIVSNIRQDVQTEISHMEQANDQLALSLDEIIEQLESFANFHLSDTKVRNLILSDDSEIDPESYEETKKILENNLILLTDMEPYVLRATLLTADGRIFKNIEEDQTDYIARMQKLAEYTNWSRGEAPYFCEPRKEKINMVMYSVISIIMPVWNVVEEEPVGYIFLDLDYNKFQSQWEQTAQISRETDFMVLSYTNILFDSDDRNGYTADTEIVNMRSYTEVEGIFRVHGERCMVVMRKYEASGWRLIQYIPLSYFAQQIFSNMSVFVIILLLVILVTIIGILGFSEQVSYPVRILSDAMGRVALDANEEQEISLFEDTRVSQYEEIGKIVESYNAMAKRINDNIIKTYTYKLRQKQAELKMLQFQINPHFLYNALNTIGAIAELENVEYIPQISANLADMFRYNIKGNDIVMIREELEHTLNYMGIQMIRFPNRFQVITDMDESLKDCSIIKFVLQPIVENSYKYGFAKRKKQDIIKIKACRFGEDVVISVEDNGIGIEKGKVEELNASLETAENIGGSDGIGLRNVNYRLKNFYGDAYGISIESEVGEYTRINMKIRYTVDTGEVKIDDKSNSSGR